jgi:hypothetical protein
MAHVTQNTGEQEHYTPVAIIESARRVMGGIDLDPASNDTAQTWIKAQTYYSKETNGLDKMWSGRVWMNPPYARHLLPKFIDKLIRSADTQVTEYIVLINNTTETEHGQRLLGTSHAVCFPRKRIRFIRPDGSLGGSPLQGQMIVYYGPNTCSFLEEFSHIGVVLTVCPY